MTAPEPRPFEDTSGSTPVRGYLHIPASASGANDGFVLTHGAGADCRSPLLVALATAFCESGLTVLRCDLPFRQLRSYGPPPRGSSPRDQQGLRQAIEIIKQQIQGRVFLGGHSYGGRQGSMLAASEPALVDALLLLSYPLHPPKRPDELRTAHFPALRTPTLFVHGTNDAFGTVEELRASLKLIPTMTGLLPISNAGHELMTARNRADLPKLVTEAFVDMARVRN